MMEKRVVISQRAVERLRGGHLWVYSSDIVRRGEISGGDVVSLYDERGVDYGYAFYSDSSQITLRRFAPAGDYPDFEFWRNRFIRAEEYRQLVVADSNAYRLIFSEGDVIPSLIIDRYGEHFVLQTLAQGSDKLKDTWVRLLRALYSPESIVERNDASIRRHENLPLEKGVLYGEAPDEVTVRMNGVEFGYDLLGGQKTGAFLDQRENYAAAARYAKGRVLDTFTFAGGFALHMAPHVDEVLAVDISGEALSTARANARRNNAANVEMLEANAFDLLHDYNKAGEKFDTIVLDPPAFAKNKASMAGAHRGYKDINLRALRMLNPGGILITCSCSYHMSEPLFLEMLAEARTDAGRPTRIIEQRLQARDHPILLGVPETKYLKCVILQVLG
ncbi:MAG: class I SAM-dependent rRNA methyltransferase [bacterium]